MHSLSVSKIGRIVAIEQTINDEFIVLRTTFCINTTFLVGGD